MCAGPAEARGVAAPSLCSRARLPAAVRNCCTAVARSRWGRTRASPGTFGSFPTAPRPPGTVRPGLRGPDPGRIERGGAEARAFLPLVGTRRAWLGPGGRGGWT